MFKKGEPIHLFSMSRPNSRNIQRAAEKTERRAKVKAFMETTTESLTIGEIALHFLVNISTIRRDLKALGISLKKS